MSLNHNHVIYDNFVLENEIEDQFNTRLDLMQFCTVDSSLDATAGMKVTIHKYTGTSGTEQLAMGAGNTKNIEVSYDDNDYTVLLLQNRFPYYDEEQMKDPMVVEVGVGRMASDMFNISQDKIYAEYKKGSKEVVSAKFNFDAFVDAAAEIKLPEDETERLGTNVFAFVNPKDVAEVRKSLKDDLKYIEAFARVGYIGTVAGINVYTKRDATQGTIVVATQKAVTYFVKKGVEVEQKRDANIRLNEIFSRKYFVPALTDDTQVCRIVKTATTPTTPSADSSGTGTGDDATESGT